MLGSLRVMSYESAHADRSVAVFQSINRNKHVASGALGRFCHAAARWIRGCGHLLDDRAVQRVCGCL